MTPPATASLDQRCSGLASDLQAKLGANLQSLVLYGSAVRGDSDPDSDLNLLIVLQESTPEAHAAMAPVLHKCAPVSPFVLGARGLERSLLLFGPKFQSIRRNYRVLAGTDPLAHLPHDDSVSWLLIEQALRNLRLRLVNGYLHHADDPRAYARFLDSRAGVIFTELSNLVECSGTDLPAKHPERIPVIAKTLGCDPAVLTDLEAFKHSPTIATVAEIIEWHRRCFELLNLALRWLEERWPR